MSKKYWSVAEAATFYGVAERTIRDRCAAGALTAERKVGRTGKTEWQIERESKKRKTPTNPQAAKQPVKDDDWTAEETAKYLGLSITTVRRRLKSGEICGYQIGSENSPEWRINPETVREITAKKLLGQENAAVQRRQVKEEARHHLFHQNIEILSNKVFSGRITPITPPKTKKKVSRILNILYSDLHFGSDLKVAKCRSNYGRIEEARRLGFTVEQVCSYKPEHRDETILNVHLNGDIIENQLHDLRAAADLSEQVLRATHLLGQAIAHFSAKFREVNVYCTTGNHDRITSRHPNRAVEDKYDSFATIIYGFLSQLTSNLSNVTFHIPLLPYTEFDLFGKKAILTHSDNVIMTGSTNKSINVGSIENQINKINSSLVDLEEYSVVALGHIHKGMCIALDNGSTLITNPALIPPNSYALSLGIFESRTGQAMWESVEGFPVGDFRFIWVTKETDARKDLDAIIKPWPGL